ncbi:MAG: ATP-binding protein [Bacteroidales bacterium]|jgi:predicted ATPase|nr:ATP-binding protein [Bacteroidales bacterium]
MITKIYVDGFRSLKKFSLQLTPGLNILVGPNGSGKTNIISFFEFLSNIVSFGASEAINKLGGAGSVFSKCDDTINEFQHQITVEVTGSSQETNKKYINYLYQFKLDASVDFNNIVFSEQIIKILIGDVFSSDFPDNNKSFILEKYITTNKSSYNIKNHDKKYVNSPFLNSLFRENKKLKTEDIMKYFLEDILDDEYSLVMAISYIFNDKNLIYEDLRSGQVFNFIPSKIKIPEDTSSNIGIQKDGSGLAATLYAIQKNEGKKNKEKGLRRRFFIRSRQLEFDIQHVNINDIIKYVHTANQSIKNINVDNDRFENLLKIKFSIEENGKQITLPISSMSDGTIKWLSFITSILTSPTVFSIEEPENYLHPLMQSEIINFMRNSIENKRSLSTIIMSTHSETILNQANPEEIIITEFLNGNTIAKRCSNAKEISDEIRNTGFGVGYYYISGSLEHE